MKRNSLMSFFTVIAWLESHRLKQHLTLLSVLLMGYFLVISCDFNLLSHVSADYQFKFESHGNQPTTGLGETLNYLQLLPPVGSMVLALCLGILVMMTMPYRSRTDWQSGMFLQFQRSDHALLFIETMRFGFLLVLSVIFLGIVQATSSFVVMKLNLLTHESLLKGQGIVAFWYITLVPVLLALGSVISAANIAYYPQNRKARCLGFVKIAGIFAILNGGGHLLDRLIQTKDQSWIPKVSMVSIEIAFSDQIYSTSILPLLTVLTWLLAASMIYGSSKILETIEV